MQGSPNSIYKEFLLSTGGEIAVCRHPQRQCVYEEAVTIKQEKKDNDVIVDDQMDYYHKLNYPCLHGLYSLRVIVRLNTDRMRVAGFRWWEQICKFASRDQLSFPVVMWSLGIHPVVLPQLAFRKQHSLFGCFGRR